MADLIIRPARSPDACLIAGLEQLAFSDPYSEAAIRDMLSVSYSRAFLCTDQSGHALAYLCGTSIPPEGELLRIAVHPSARRRGIGLRLLQTFLLCLRGDGDTVCYLDVRAGNEPAQALYRALAFTVCGRRRAYYKHPTEDALEMKCNLLLTSGDHVTSPGTEA